MATKEKNTAEKGFTPMVEQYLSFKKEYGDIILFFRIGDFYEMFLEDAQIASKELSLFLTRKAAGNGQFIPMCGVPHHAYLSYAQKLVDRGYKVAIVEQVEDPRLTKKLVKRDVVQIISPGANIDPTTIDNNYIASLFVDLNQAFICYADLTTGEMKLITIENNTPKILEKLLSLEIRELVLSTDTNASLILYIKSNSNICISYSNDDSYTLDMQSLFTNLSDPRQLKVTARLYNYLKSMERKDLNYFKPVINMMEKKTMKIDYSAQSNMELVKSLEGKNFGTLYWLMNKCMTPMGSRYLKTQICSPSASEKDIENRLNITETFVENYLDRETLRDDLSGVSDMERLIARMGYESANGHDLLQLKKSLALLPKIHEDLNKIESDRLSDIDNEIGYYDELVELLEKAIREDCPITIMEGEIFKKGYNAELDELIEMSEDSRVWINNLEIKEKERTGIKTLSVGYNNAFGFYIEIPLSQIPLIKDEYGYIRKQTFKTGERYVTQELKEKENLILRAKEKRMSLEYKLFKDLRKTVSEYTQRIQATSDALSRLDYFLTLAYIASENNYIRPIFNGVNKIEVKNARHPIIEKAAPDTVFVANDYFMSNKTDILIITGPNMGGKSTYMKEFGLLVIMAQMGSFIPADYASLPIFDSLYTRIGASDNLIKGQSTFMTEMSEVAEALEDANTHSLFLFDEIGRGTATFDGMAIAQAIIEYIVRRLHCKTFFSTHYHEITKLSEKISAVSNIHCDVKEDNGKVTFLYKMKEGSMDKSYGINVARLAGLPDELISRADELLVSLEQNKNIKKEQIKEIKKEENTEDPVLAELKELDPMTLSPLDALNYLIRIKKRIR